MNDFILEKVRKDHFLVVYEEKRIIGKLLLVTIFISLLIMICTATAVKMNVKREASLDELSFASPNRFIGEADLNSRESKILTLLLNVIGSGDELEQQPDTYTIYVDILHQQFSMPDFKLSFTSYNKIKRKIDDLYFIILNEGTCHLKQMSIDGRTIVQYSLEQIYKECNLKINFDENRVIKSIYDNQDNLLYEANVPDTRKEFHISAAISLSVILIVLGSLCYLISNKKHLFVKKVSYDGFDEKKFA